MKMTEPHYFSFRGLKLLRIALKGAVRTEDWHHALHCINLYRRTLTELESICKRKLRESELKQD